MDWDAPLTSDDDTEAVEVPASLDPTVDSDSNGIDHYLNTICFVERKVSNSILL